MSLDKPRLGHVYGRSLDPGGRKFATDMALIWLHYNGYKIEACEGGFIATKEKNHGEKAKPG